jgi:hypothetical protein
MAQVVGQLAPIADVAYGPVWVDIWGFHTHVRGITVVPAIPFMPAQSMPKFAIREMIVHRWDRQNPAPAYIKIALKGIGIDGGGAAPSPLQELGYDGPILIDLDFDYEYRAKDRELELRRLGFGAVGLGQVQLAVRLGNVAPEDVIAKPDLSQALTFILGRYQQILVQRAELVYEDDSLVPRLLQLQARQEGLTVQQIIDRSTSGLAASGVSGETVRSIRAFLAQPHRIGVIASPERGVPVGVIQRREPQDLSTLLNVRVEVSR